MPEILQSSAPRPPYNGTPLKFSAVGVIIVVILSVVLILLGERLIFDLNRWINPMISQTASENYYYDYNSTMSVEKSVLAPGVSIQYPTIDKGKYEIYKLSIHAAFIVSVFLLVFLLYYLVKIKNQKEGWRAVIYGFMAFAFWMILHLLGETVGYVSSQYKNAAIYIILGILALVLTPLAIFLQKKHSEKIASV